MDLRQRRRAIAAAKFTPEEDAVGGLLAAVSLTAEQRRMIEDRATQLVEGVRARSDEHSMLDVFLQEFGLGNEEGVALMCLAEALLRIPDADTIDALIADKIVPGRWADHLGQSGSTFVNASTWGLLLTGRVLAMDRFTGRTPTEVLGRLVGRLGEPVIRNAMRQAMRILGAEFVLGRTIEEAIERGIAEHGTDARFSFDMLGEGARTAADAERYCDAYGQALARVGTFAGGKGSRAGSGISVKLSALHPRYEYAQRRRVVEELYPRLLLLAKAAARQDVGLSIDAEESDRLELSLELFEALAGAPELSGWEGLGLVVQAYGKRAYGMVEWLEALARARARRFQVRLVKGAYWDAEIKRAQEQGWSDFPVFTQKAHTDVAYIACAERLLAARAALYPQFATHNAHTLTAVLALGASADDCEFQRLHGMGELLYRVAAEQFDALPPVRIYAPVGGHRDLLAYLVRRLLENGANSSFVNRFLDAEVAAREVVRDPLAAATELPPRHPSIRLPAALYGERRPNSKGFDLTDPAAVAALEAVIAAGRSRRFAAGGDTADAKRIEVRNPADRDDLVGMCTVADALQIDAAFARAAGAQPAWDGRGGAARAAVLRALGDALEADRDTLMTLLLREAGRTIPDALAEIREAVDFCRYYAFNAEAHFEAPERLDGPTGERNELSLHGRGVFVCISPWNFPLAIFLGQIAAALAAGNAVVAKPAEQTPLIGARAVELAHAAGVPGEVLAYVPGGAAVGRALIADARCAGVAFTGSTATATAINRVLAARDGPIVPLIAETGGQNAMFVDSTALLEQLTDDVLRSAFGSAGQRCSALRILLLQRDIADRALAMLIGAMHELTIGDPTQLETDIGPLIEADAVERLAAHTAALAAAGCRLETVALPASCANGSFMAPHIAVVEDLSMLEEEHFGPVLHVLRYDVAELDEMIDAVRGLGFGLTMGIHSRIDERVQHVFERSAVGNTYVNRNMIGAVVGVQPFGGQGLSGTGPKAGGPHYLPRFAVERTLTVNTMAKGGNIELLRGG
jgi:RHH-type proline utilization regulon transcriptional repressor/proline dehydrogenase/delta 1-pyrroline-5-carboxylate dehydrogenase